jgi:hypothetical protein
MGKIEDLKRELKALEGEWVVLNEALQNLEEGLAKSHESIQGFTTNQLVGSLEQKSELVRVIVAFLPEEDGLLVRKNLNNRLKTGDNTRIETEHSTISNNTNNTNDVSEDTFENNNNSANNNTENSNESHKEEKEREVLESNESRNTDQLIGLREMGDNSANLVPRDSSVIANDMDSLDIRNNTYLENSTNSVSSNNNNAVKEVATDNWNPLNAYPLPTSLVSFNPSYAEQRVIIESTKLKIGMCCFSNSCSLLIL